MLQDEAARATPPHTPVNPRANKDYLKKHKKQLKKTSKAGKPLTPINEKPVSMMS